MVKTMPTKDAVSSDTPRLLGPTSLSCSMVLALWNLPTHHAGYSDPSQVHSRTEGVSGRPL